MKRKMKKNQIIVTSLAIMIAVAGYLTFSDDLKKQNKKAQNQIEESITTGSEEVAVNTNVDKENKEQSKESEEINVLGEDESSDISENDTPGEAVLTGSSMVISQARLTKDQTRAQNEASLKEIINSDGITDTEKQKAVDAMVKITENSEKEAAAESLLKAKGFTNVMVSIGETSVDVVVNDSELDDTKIAQIADIVKRKTGVTNDKIVITPVSESAETNK